MDGGSEKTDAHTTRQPSASLDRGGRFRSFQDLMLWRVDNILLVSSLYDSFIVAEDGHLHELILGEFLGLNLRRVPDLTRVSTGAEALEFIRHTGRYNLIIASPHVGDMHAAELAQRVRETGIEVPVVLLGYDDREVTEYIENHGVEGLDGAFLWQGDVRIILAIVKYIEDQMNAEHDIHGLGVQAILVIEDNIHYYSSFLPIIYKEVVEHTRSLVPRGINLSHKLLRIKARPKILLSHNYEEAWGNFIAYQDHILGVISDVDFKRHGKQCPEAGIRFARRVIQMQPDVPVLLQSGRAENEELAFSAGATFLQKGVRGFVHGLRHFMLANFGFGDFVFRLEDGSEVCRASDLEMLEEVLHTVPAESLKYHAERNHFSVWLKAHTEFGIAERLRPLTLADFKGTEHLRRDLIATVHRYRAQSRRGVVADFHPREHDPETDIARIGGGSLGGKARGLAFVNRLLADFGVENRFPGIRIAVPPSVVLGTDVFDEFLKDTALLDQALRATDDAELLEKFDYAEFPESATEALREYLKETRYPLAVRSSSLLEDSKYEPFAGIYDTLMIPNTNDDLEVRLQQLVSAVKRIYASSFSQRAKRNLAAGPYGLEEKMAVLLQKLAGRVRGGRFYPDFAGVAMSQNFYPTGPVKPEDGMTAVALGLGFTVVNGETCLRFSPRYPHHVVQFSSVEATLRSSQQEFYALQIDADDDREPGIELGKFGLDIAEEDGTLAWVGSTYSRENDAVYDGVARQGARLVTFAPILKQDVFPLPEILNVLLELGAYATGVPVEIEFAVTRPADPDAPVDFAFLQFRPVALSGALAGPELANGDLSAAICHSTVVLGNGIIDGIHDIVMVDVARYERTNSRKVAGAIARINGTLVRQGRPYLLISVGRLGSSEPLLGIPVTWGQIDGARVIVEAGFRDFHVRPSQGTHFFQNITAHRIGFFTVNAEVGEGFVDWPWLAEQPALSEDGPVRHLRFATPIVAKLNGSRNEGVILRPAIPEG